MVKEFDKFQEPSKFAIIFANTVFVLGILFSLLVVIYSIYKIYNPPEFVTITFYLIVVVVSGICAILFGFGLKLNNNLKLNLTVLFITTGIGFYTFETYLMFAPEKKQDQPILKIIKQMGDNYDTRTRIEVLEDLNKMDLEVYPNVFPYLFVQSNGLSSNNKKIYPLGGIANITTILDNESGYYPIIETDEHGFNNPKGLYKKNDVDIVLTGDSFTEGVAVHANETISAVLRNMGFNSLSIGQGGNGPLIELAALKEYAEPLEPKVVLWLYFWGDYWELKGEMGSSILKKYLNNDDFTQNLITRQDEIDRVLKNFVTTQWGLERKQEKKNVTNKELKHKVIKILKIYNIRSMINIIPGAVESEIINTSMEKEKRDRLMVLKNILYKSKKMVARWEGKLYFVYMSPHPHNNKYPIEEELLSREFVIPFVRELNIPLIDLNTELFGIHPDPKSLFPLRVFGHYTPEGYRLVAETISQRLKDDGIIPSNLDN